MYCEVGGRSEGDAENQMRSRSRMGSKGDLSELDIAGRSLMEIRREILGRTLGARDEDRREIEGRSRGDRAPHLRGGVGDVYSAARAELLHAHL